MELVLTSEMAICHVTLTPHSLSTFLPGGDTATSSRSALFHDFGGPLYLVPQPQPPELDVAVSAQFAVKSIVSRVLYSPKHNRYVSWEMPLLQSLSAQSYSQISISNPGADQKILK